MASNIVPAATGGQIEFLRQDPKKIREIILANDIQVNDLSRIKLPTGGGTTWSIPSLEGEEMAREIVAVVIASRYARAFWKRSFGKGSANAPPDCFSNDAATGQGDPGGDCETCPYAQWNSAAQLDPAKSGRAQACRKMAQLLLLRPKTFMPELLNVTPGSLQAWRRFSMRLITAGIPAHEIVTRITLRQAQNEGGITYAQCEFNRASSDLTAEEKKSAVMFHDVMNPIMRTYTLAEKDFEVLEDDTEEESNQ